MIRYDSEYNKNIERVVSNFNRKIARLQRQGAVLLPQKVSIRDIKNQFYNRTELNTYLRDLQRFSRRGAENIVEIGGKQYTSYDVDIFRRRLRRERSRLNREIAEAEVMTTQYPMQHDVYTANLKASRKAISGSWNTLLGQFQEKFINEPYRHAAINDNYLQTLFVDAYQVGFEDEKIEYIKQKLLSLPPRKFIRALEDDPNIQYIFDYYHSLTRTSLTTSDSDSNAYDAFQQIYENIDAIVEKYK